MKVFRPCRSGHKDRRAKQQCNILLGFNNSASSQAESGAEHGSRACPGILWKSRENIGVGIYWNSMVGFSGVFRISLLYAQETSRQRTLTEKLSFVRLQISLFVYHTKIVTSAVFTRIMPLNVFKLRHYCYLVFLIIHSSCGLSTFLHEYEWMNEWVNEWMNEWMNEWLNSHTRPMWFLTVRWCCCWCCILDVLVLKDLINHASGKKGNPTVFSFVSCLFICNCHNDSLNFHAVSLVAPNLSIFWGNCISSCAFSSHCNSHCVFSSNEQLRFDDSFSGNCSTYTTYTE